MNKVKNLEVYEGMLIVVDMVNGFVREGVLHDEKIATDKFTLVYPTETWKKQS